MSMKRASSALIVMAILSGTQTTAQSATSAPAAATSSDAAQEGVKVHGEWTLTVRNPDGTVASRHEFKNALAINSGAHNRLALLLGGEAVPGKWTVTLYASGNACVNGPCYITEGEVPSHTDSTNLTKSVAQSGPDMGKFVLRGSVRVPIDSTIVRVTTGLGVCAASVAPASCASASGGDLTQRILSAGVPVVHDQLVEVSVVISFS